MSYQHITVPENGQKITVQDGRLSVPDNPILGYVEGDGIGQPVPIADRERIVEPELLPGLLEQR